MENLVESQIQISNDIAHDLRTPLQRLRQRLEKMSGLDVVDPADARAALEQTEDVINTFNALLRIAQIESGDRREKFQPTELGSLLANVHEAFEPSAEDGGQVLQIHTPGKHVFVLGDPDLLMQLMSNMVENALRHTPEGTTIEMQVSHIANHPVLTVSDNGSGIVGEDFLKTSPPPPAPHHPAVLDPAGPGATPDRTPRETARSSRTYRAHRAGVTLARSRSGSAHAAARSDRG